MIEAESQAQKSIAKHYTAGIRKYLGKKNCILFVICRLLCFIGKQSFYVAFFNILHTPCTWRRFDTRKCRSVVRAVAIENTRGQVSSQAAYVVALT